MGDDKEKTVIDTIKLIEDLVEQLRQCSRLVGDAEMRRVLEEAEAFLTSSPHPEAREEDVLSDEDIAKIGYECGLGFLADLLDDDNFNTIEMRLQHFARRIFSLSRLAAKEDEGKIKAFHKVGFWLSAALDDPKVAPEFKDAINELFEAFGDYFGLAQPAAPATSEKPEEPSTSKDSLQVEPATAPTVGDAIQASESNSPETPDGSPRDCDTCRWEGRSLLCCDCRDRAHWQPVPRQSEDIPSPMTMAEIRIAMQDQCKETQALRSQLARKDEGMREALEEAAQSLEALAGLAGKDETMLEYDQVRGYALNRAMAARAALREPAPVASHDASDTIRNAGSVSHDNREPDGRMGGVR